MTQTQESRPEAASAGASQPANGSVAQTGDNTWWTHPGLAYARGLQDGAQLALEEIAGVLLEVLGQGKQEHDRADPIDVLIRYRTQVAARGGTGWTG